MTVQIHDLRAGADVYSSDGQKLGTLHRVVIKRADLSVSHIVVDIGFLRSGRHIWEGGIDLEYDRLAPIDVVTGASDERVTLALTAAQFKDAPEYTEEGFEPPQDMTPNEFDLPDVVNRLEAFSAMLGSMSNVWLVEKLNKPLDGVDIKEGTPVWRQHPHEKIGDVEGLVLDEANGRVKAFLIRRGFLFKKDVYLPVRYVSELLDDIIRVEIADEELAQLKERP